MSGITVTKRNGEREPFQPEKTNKWADWAAGGDSHMWSQLSMNAFKKLSGDVTTQDIQEALISTAVDLIEEDVNYQKPAAKLFVADIRKQVFGTYVPPSFYGFFTEMIDRGYWDPELADHYDSLALVALERELDHSRDYLFPYSGIRQMSDKYLLRRYGELKETPQFMYMGLAMAAMAGEPLEDCIDFYHAISQHKINLPTPVLIGLRTPSKGFASCCVITAGDSLDSLEAAHSVVWKMTANRAGIGIELDCRSVGDSVDNGRVTHQGKLPYYQWIAAAVKANKQQSRGGSATMQYKCFDPEIMTLLRLRSQRVSEERRIDTMDYSMAYNDYFAKLMHANKEITLMSIHDEPEVWEAFVGKDLKHFVELYEKAAQNPKYRKIPAREVFFQREQQALDTGRIYMHNIGETNRRSTFKSPVRQSNLCLEIALPTSAMGSVLDLYNPKGEGEIALCNLGGMVMNRIDDDVEMERVSYLLTKAIDRVIDIQTYPFPLMEATTKARRNLGIGYINMAHELAQLGLSYVSKEGRSHIHRQCERMSYFLHKASVRLAKEKGACDLYHDTTYSDGVFPHESAKAYVDEHHDAELMYDWDSLRKEMDEHGIRNSVLEAYMPSESSSVTIGATNGIEPIRQGIVSKESRSGSVVQVAPEWDELEFDYEFAFDLDQVEWARTMGVIQKFVGQTISTNQYWDYNKYEGQKIPMQDNVKVLLEYVKLGVKTCYYKNTDVSTGGSVHCDSCTV